MPFPSYVHESSEKCIQSMFMYQMCNHFSVYKEKSKIWGSQGSEAVDCSLLGCDADYTVSQPCRPKLTRETWSCLPITEDCTGSCMY